MFELLCRAPSVGIGGAGGLKRDAHFSFLGHFNESVVEF